MTFVYLNIHRHLQLASESLIATSLRRKLDNSASEINASNSAIEALRQELTACHKTISMLESSQRLLQTANKELVQERDTWLHVSEKHQTENIRLEKELAKFKPTDSNDSIADARSICLNCGKRNAEVEKVFNQVVELTGQLARAKHTADFHKTSHINAVNQVCELLGLQVDQGLLRSNFRLHMWLTCHHVVEGGKTRVQQNI